VSFVKEAANRLMKEFWKLKPETRASLHEIPGMFRPMERYSEGFITRAYKNAKKHNIPIEVSKKGEGSHLNTNLKKDGTLDLKSTKMILEPAKTSQSNDVLNAAAGAAHESDELSAIMKLDGKIYNPPTVKMQVPEGYIPLSKKIEVNEKAISMVESARNRIKKIPVVNKLDKFMGAVSGRIKDKNDEVKKISLKILSDGMSTSSHANFGILGKESNLQARTPYKLSNGDFRMGSGEAEMVKSITGARYGIDYIKPKDMKKLINRKEHFQVELNKTFWDNWS